MFKIRAFSRLLVTESEDTKCGKVREGRVGPGGGVTTRDSGKGDLHGVGVTTDQLTSLVMAVFLAPCGDVIVLGRNPMGRAEWRCVHRATWPNLTHDVQLNRPFTKLQLFPVPSAGQGSTPESLEDELHLLPGSPNGPGFGRLSPTTQVNAGIGKVNGQRRPGSLTRAHVDCNVKRVYWELR